MKLAQTTVLTTIAIVVFAAIGFSLACCENLSDNITDETNIRQEMEFSVPPHELAGLPKAPGNWGTLTADNMPNNIGNTFTGNPETTRTIYWQSRTPEGEVIIDGRLIPSTFKNTDPWYFHRVDVTGLKPGTSYQYVAGTTDFYSPVYEFATFSFAEGASFSAIHITDPQIGTGSYAGDATIWKRVLDTALELYPDAAFIVNTGDIAENSRTASLTFYFDYVQDKLAKYPFIYSMGNNDAVTWYNQYFYVPDNNYYNGFLFSFDFGNAHFVNYTNYMYGANPTLGNAYINWLRDDLQASDKQWKVGMTHQGSYVHQNSNNSLTILFYQENVELVMCGHNHRYLRSKVVDNLGNEKPKGEGTVWIVPNAAGSKFNSITPRDWLEAAKQPNLPMFVVYTFSDTNIDLKAYTVSTSGVATEYDSYSWR